MCAMKVVMRLGLFCEVLKTLENWPRRDAPTDGNQETDSNE